MVVILCQGNFELSQVHTQLIMKQSHKDILLQKQIYGFGVTYVIFVTLSQLCPSFGNTATLNYSSAYISLRFITKSAPSRSKSRTPSIVEQIKGSVILLNICIEYPTNSLNKCRLRVLPHKMLSVLLRRHLWALQRKIAV